MPDCDYECDRERKRIPGQKSNVMEESLPQGSPTHPQDMEDLSIRGWAKRAIRSRDEATRTVDKRQCKSGWELFCIESSCWLVANGERRVKKKKWCMQILELCTWGKLSSCPPFKLYHGEPEKSQQGKHHNNQTKCMTLPSIKYHRERVDTTEIIQAYSWPVQCQQQSVGNGCWVNNRAQIIQAEKSWDVSVM